MSRWRRWLGEGIRRILGLEWLVVGAAAPLLMFPTLRPHWTAAALAMLVVWWLLRWAVRGEPWPVTPFNGALLLFALMVPVGIWASAVPDLTLPKAAGLILGLAVFRAVALAVDSRRLNLALALFCLIGLAVLVVGVFGARWSAKVGPLYTLTRHIPWLIQGLPESQADAVSPNQLAGALTLYLPLALALVSIWRFSRRAIIGPLLGLVGSLLFLALVAGTLLLTQSRSGWMGGTAGILALVSLAGLTSRRRWARWLGGALPVLAMLAVVVLILHLGPQQLGENLFGKESASPVEEAVGAITLEDRVEIWSRALYAIHDFPFTGCGLGAFRRVVPILYPFFTVPPDTDIAHAHNIFLQTALDLGIPGLVAYLALLGIALGVCWRVALTPSPAASGGFPLPLSRSAGEGEGGRGVGVRALALGLAAGLIALHVYGMTDALALGSKPAVAFWYALGIVAALGQRQGLSMMSCATSTDGLVASRF
jgi:putative inorganic carbon (HCO3(-)) transporter